MTPPNSKIWHSPPPIPQNIPSGSILEKIFPEGPSQEWASSYEALAGEVYADLFHQDLLALGRDLEDQDILGPAVKIYQYLVQHFPEGELGKSAAFQLSGLLGTGDAGSRLEFQSKRFLSAATDWKMIVPMIAASSVYPLGGRAVWTSLTRSSSDAWWSQGIGAKALSSGAGFLAETTVFSLGSRGLHAAMGAEVSWDLKSVGSDWLSAGLTLGVLKGSGQVGRYGMQRYVMAKGEAGLLAMDRMVLGLLGHGSGYLGLVGAHQLESSLGWSEGGGSPWLDGMSAYLSLSLGAKLGYGILGKGFTNWQQNLRSQKSQEGKHWSEAMGIPIRIEGSLMTFFPPNEDLPQRFHIKWRKLNPNTWVIKQGARSFHGQFSEVPHIAKMIPQGSQGTGFLVPAVHGAAGRYVEFWPQLGEDWKRWRVLLPTLKKFTEGLSSRSVTKEYELLERWDFALEQGLQRREYFEELENFFEDYKKQGLRLLTLPLDLSLDDAAVPIMAQAYYANVTRNIVRNILDNRLPTGDHFSENLEKFIQEVGILGKQHSLDVVKGVFENLAWHSLWATPFEQGREHFLVGEGVTMSDLLEQTFLGMGGFLGLYGPSIAKTSSINNYWVTELWQHHHVENMGITGFDLMVSPPWGEAQSGLQFEIIPREWRLHGSRADFPPLWRVGIHFREEGIRIVQIQGPPREGPWLKRLEGLAQLERRAFGDTRAIDLLLAYTIAWAHAQGYNFVEGIRDQDSRARREGAIRQKKQTSSFYDSYFRRFGFQRPTQKHSKWLLPLAPLTIERKTLPPEDNLLVDRRTVIQRGRISLPQYLREVLVRPARVKRVKGRSTSQVWDHSRPEAGHPAIRTFWNLFGRASQKFQLSISQPSATPEALGVPFALRWRKNIKNP